jgi:hypothetical protein
MSGYVSPELFVAATAREDALGRPYIQIDDMRFPVNAQKTFAYKGSLWSWGTLAYELDAQVKANSLWVSQFVRACRILTATTGVACIDRAAPPIDTQDYVYVVNGSTNDSFVGMVGGQQTLTIASWDNAIIIAHEIKHALGFVHEQSRPDRDQYVVIHTDNIQPDALHNFDVVAGATTNFPYNFDSIMQYGPLDFSNDGLKTIEPQPAYQALLGQMGQRTHISAQDISEITEIYGVQNTEWCGVTRQPRRPPSGCFWECTWQEQNPRNGKWWLCGNCSGAQKCP